MFEKKKVMARFIADLHIHSKYSIATSKHLSPDWLDFWARAKGIGLIGTGDFTHPKWLDVLQEQLEESAQGLYKLKSAFKHRQNWVRESTTPHFMLTAEVHTILWAPSFEIAQKIQTAFEKRNFNIRSDGRPIIGLDAYDLLAMCLEISEDIAVIPAHIWTPWFSVLGAKSGYESIEECYGDLTPHIFAVETGLSSDTPMNFMCSMLDSFALLSNSDAHSPEKIGRNANIFNCKLSYNAIIQALKDRNGKSFEGTIDMYPQEGKYHYAGHRACNVCVNPLEVLQHKFMCPTCKKPFTLGVFDRVAQLSDRDDISICESWQKTIYAIPLKEILSDLYDKGENTKTIQQAYTTIIAQCESEIDFLCFLPLTSVAEIAPPLLLEGIRRMREGDIFVSPGYDGEYGKIAIFSPDEKKLFALDNTYQPTQYKKLQKKRFSFDLSAYHELAKNTDFSIQTRKKADTQLRLF
jgi:DNA helicase II / ATP-dependent DNA helicase PcrA